MSRPVVLDDKRPVASALEALGEAGSPTALAATMGVTRGTVTGARDRALDGVSVALLRRIVEAGGKRLQIRVVDPE